MKKPPTPRQVAEFYSVTYNKQLTRQGEQYPLPEYREREEAEFLLEPKLYLDWMDEETEELVPELEELLEYNPTLGDMTPELSRFQQYDNFAMSYLIVCRKPHLGLLPLLLCDTNEAFLALRTNDRKRIQGIYTAIMNAHRFPHSSLRLDAVKVYMSNDGYPIVEYYSYYVGSFLEKRLRLRTGDLTEVRLIKPDTRVRWLRKETPDAYRTAFDLWG